MFVYCSFKDKLRFWICKKILPTLQTTRKNDWNNRCYALLTTFSSMWAPKQLPSRDLQSSQSCQQSPLSKHWGRRHSSILSDHSQIIFLPFLSLCNAFAITIRNSNYWQPTNLWTEVGERDISESNKCLPPLVYLVNIIGLYSDCRKGIRKTFWQTDLLHSEPHKSRWSEMSW